MMSSIKKKYFLKITSFWSRKKVSCLKHGSEIRGFFLKQGQGLKASSEHTQPNFP